MSEPFTLASSLVGVDWCGRTSSSYSLWHGEGDGPVKVNFLKASKEGRIVYITLSADHLVAVKLGSQGLQRWLDDTSTETENKMKS